MDEDGYRSREKKLVLPASGTIPETPCALDQDEQDAAISWLARVEQATDSLQSNTGRGLIKRSVPTGAERYLASKRWVLSHHLFIPMLALTGHALAEAVRAFECNDQNGCRKWASVASLLRRGCGALFIYSVDFEPCAPIYCGCIRNHMPPAFSGYEIRERQYCYQPAVSTFHSIFAKADNDPFIVNIRKLWVAADLRYHELHEKCMLLAVAAVAGSEVVSNNGNSSHAKPESLRAMYRRRNGDVPEIGESAFAEYDRWFAIERDSAVARVDYIYQICDVIERLMGDLLIGHRLEHSVMTDLINSIRAILIVFGHWVGPVSDLSFFYPRTLRGE